jgi:hypothetical protein
MRGERDLPEGHPSASDYVPGSKAARRYAAHIKANLSERDFPLGHPGAADNPNRVEPVHPMISARDHSRPETIIVPEPVPEVLEADDDALPN